MSWPHADARPQLVLHAGTNKTGSTAIQSFLAAHRQPLREVGVLYPELDGDPLSQTLLQKHIGLAHASGDTAPLAETLSQLQHQLATSQATKVILSTEHLFAMPRAWVPTLLEAVSPLFASVSLVIYLRSQRDLWTSLLNQRAKALKVLPTHRPWGTDEFLGPAIVENMHYADYLDAYAPLIGRDHVLAKRYDPSGFPDGSVVPDFLQTVGLASLLTRADLTAAGTSSAINPSLGWKGVALAITLAARHHALDSRRAVARAMRKAFARAHDEGLTDWLGRAACYLTEDQQRELRDIYAASNIRLADSYGPELDAFLCDPSRPHEQRGLHDIDPAELRLVNSFIGDAMADLASAETPRPSA